ncbi:MAG TPA: SRPBCC domain-containing protein [Micromonosporaceae bacterium]|jgi:uncharacterized protein YndB with AHSA1/START domain/uncharacterized protein YciI
MNELPPVRRQMIVPVPPERAFAAFTDEIGEWWPGEKSVYGEGMRPEFRDGVLIETGADGQVAEWGRVLDWQPPRSFRMTWHAGHEASEQDTEITVTFAEVADGRTLVTLEHRGWERRPDGVEARAGYVGGWAQVLAGYPGLFKAGEEAGGDAIWLALMFTPGPALAAGTSVFADPRISHHIAFLARLHEMGHLHAAGPLGDDGDGMTVVRVRSAADAAEVVRLAQDEDESVRAELLQLHVRPWHVRLGQ